jgi:hypothetical protein
LTGFINQLKGATAKDRVAALWSCGLILCEDEEQQKEEIGAGEGDAEAKRNGRALNLHITPPHQLQNRSWRASNM